MLTKVPWDPHVQGDGLGGSRGGNHHGQQRGSNWKRSGGRGSRVGAGDVEMMAAEGGAPPQQQQHHAAKRRSWADQVEAEELAYGKWREETF